MGNGTYLLTNVPTFATKDLDLERDLDRMRPVSKVVIIWMKSPMMKLISLILPMKKLVAPMRKLIHHRHHPMKNILDAKKLRMNPLIRKLVDVKIHKKLVFFRYKKKFY